MCCQRVLVKALLSFLLFAYMHPAISQTCTINNFAVNYKGSENQTIVHSLLTKQNELLCAGNINYAKNNLVKADGWLSLYTALGSVIWSKRITAPGFDLLTFRDIIAATDSSYFVTGFVQTYWGVTDPSPPNPNWGILLHIDRYGNILWSKKMDQGFETGVESTFLENIMKTSDGDFITNAVVWKKSPFQTKSMLLRINNKATVKWATTYSSDLFEFKFNLSNSIKQTSSGDIVAAGIVDQRLVSKDSILKVNYYWAGIDYATGNKRWDRSYLIRAQSANVFFTESSVRHITELPNGDLSFLGYADTNSIIVPPNSTHAVNIITNATGTIKKVNAYQTDLPGSYAIGGYTMDNTGNQFSLLIDANKSILTQLDASGNILSQKGYYSSNGLQQAADFAIGNNGYYVFMNNRSANGLTHLLKTEASGDLVCRSTPPQLTSFDGSSFFKPGDALMKYTTETKPADVFSVIALNSDPYPLQMTVDCRDACCKDVIDTINITRATICDNETYTLPNNQVVKDSGTYYITYKTASGCDSITFFHLSVIKHPSALSLGKDTCLEGKDSLTLQATPGYANYSWMNATTTFPFYTIKQPGTYSVSVANTCGSKSSSIQVFAICDPEIFIPTAFTPNGDHLNDVFRIQPSIKYKLISFTVFNRWGQVVFFSTDIMKGWDGLYKRAPQQSGRYTYIIVTESISTGRQSQKTGSVQLLR
ncbi:MAG: gliding motility-associated C-terminal domain-containing protein [Bacteroidota bacterium]